MAAATRPRSSRPAPGSSPLLVAAAAFALVVAAVGVYVVARQTSLFALDRVEVSGAPPPVAAEIRAALVSYVGRSLVRFDARAAERRLAAVTEITDPRFDRDFPHTLKVRVRLERPVAVLRRGADAWVVSSTARVLRRLDRRPNPRLPRIWLPASTEVIVNSTLGGVGAMGVAAVGALHALRVGVNARQVVVEDGVLTLVLASGTELRLGNSGDLRLKLAIAKRILPLTSGARYVDVSVPERPVAGYNPQVSS